MKELSTALTLAVVLLCQLIHLFLVPPLLARLCHTLCMHACVCLSADPASLFLIKYRSADQKQEESELQLPLHKQYHRQMIVYRGFLFLLFMSTSETVNIPQVLIPSPGSLSLIGLWVFSFLKPFAKMMAAAWSVPCQGPSKIMNTWRQRRSFVCSRFELFLVCGFRSHFTEAVSHQCALNEICLLGFSILLTVIILVNTEAFNKGVLPLVDSRSNNRIVSSLSEHTAALLRRLNKSLFLGGCCCI